MIRLSRYAMLTAVFLSMNGFAFPQGHAPDLPADATANVPALEDFHTVIMEIWHEAWPKKDTSALRKLQPDVEKGVSGVAAAPLPGILREKKRAWDENVAELKAKMAALNQAKLPERLKAREESFNSARTRLSKAVDDLSSTMAGSKDRKKIEDAVNEVHSRYETLNQIFE